MRLLKLLVVLKLNKKFEYIKNNFCAEAKHESTEAFGFRALRIKYCGKISSPRNYVTRFID